MMQLLLRHHREADPFLWRSSLGSAENWGVTRIVHVESVIELFDDNTRRKITAAAALLPMTVKRVPQGAHYYLTDIGIFWSDRRFDTVSIHFPTQRLVQVIQIGLNAFSLQIAHLFRHRWTVIHKQLKDKLGRQYNERLSLLSRLPVSNILSLSCHMVCCNGWRVHLNSNRMTCMTRQVANMRVAVKSFC